MITSTVEQLVAESPRVEAPDAGVIEEARLRQRRHRGMAGVTIVGAVAAILLGGGGGGSRPVSHLLRHGSPASGAARSSPTSCVFGDGKPLQGPPSKSLLSILGVLRRPATAADALPESFKESLTSRGVWGDVFVRYVRRTRFSTAVPITSIPQSSPDAGTSSPMRGS